MYVRPIVTRLIFLCVLALCVLALVVLMIKLESGELSAVREEIIKQLIVHDAYDENGPLELYRHGREYDGGYIVATKALKDADVLLGYGINDDNSFEDQFSLKYNKPSFGFDCGIQGIDSESKLFTLVKECIASDSFLYNKSSSNNNITSFDQQIKNLNLQGKKLFIKMDIEGAEYDAFQGIMKHLNNITGIALEIHFSGLTISEKALDLLKLLNKDFVLIHVHGNNCCVSSGFTTSNSIGKIPGVIELSYINKKLVQGFKISANQSHPLKIDQPNLKDWPDAIFTIRN
jgi:hypothetical protein